MLQNNGKGPDYRSGRNADKSTPSARYTSDIPRKQKHPANTGTPGVANNRTLQDITERNPFLTVKKCNLPSFIVVTVMILYLISEILLSGNYINSSNPYVTVVIAQFCVYLIPCAFFFAFSSLISKVTPKNFGFKTPSLKLLGFGFSSLFVLVFGGMLIKYSGYLIFGTVNSSAVSVSANSDFLYILLSGIVVPAITEEVLFRGVVFGVYERKLGSFTAILASSVLFAFIHFDSVNFFSYLYAGIILGIAMTVTRSVIAPILLHLFNNFICIFSDTYLQRISKESISAVFVVFILTVLLLVVLFFYFESLELYCREKALEKSQRKSDSPRLFVTGEPKTIVLARAFLAPSFIIALSIYLIKVLTM